MCSANTSSHTPSHGGVRWKARPFPTTGSWKSSAAVAWGGVYKAHDKNSVWRLANPEGEKSMPRSLGVISTLALASRCCLASIRTRSVHDSGASCRTVTSPLDCDTCSRMIAGGRWVSAAGTSSDQFGRSTATSIDTSRSMLACWSDRQVCVVHGPFSHDPVSMKAPFPNFFVIGAAKSGTASLHEYLSQHPDIYMSPVK